MASKGPRSKLDHETRARRQKALEASREPQRPKTHWDHVLEEMVWLSKDFESERKWKLAQAKKVAFRASKGMLDQATRGEKKLKEEEQRLRKVALNISKDVKKFWVKIEKLVLYKHQIELDERKKKALDKQLEFLLDQTERYSTMLAENLADKQIQIAGLDQPSNQHRVGDDTDAKGASNSIDGHGLDAMHDDSNFNAPAGDQFKDGEHTIEEDGAVKTKEERQEEFEALHSEVDSPPEKLLRRDAVDKAGRESSPHEHGCDMELGSETNDNGREGGHSVDNDIGKRGSPIIYGRRCGKTNGVLSPVDNHLVDTNKITNLSVTPRVIAEDRVPCDLKDEQEDVDFSPSLGEEKDDETTLLEEEELAKADQDGAEDEIALLQKESEIPIEQLLARYRKEIDNEILEDDSQHTDSSSDNLFNPEDHDEFELTKQESLNENKPLPNPLLGGHGAEMESTSDGREETPDEREGNENRIADAAAAARSAQPTGNTFSTTKVCTKFPFLLKYPLREYQHIGLDWLVTMYEKRLNGILADEMGLGKTIMTIALLAHLACEKGIWGPHLIVVPTSVMLNWETEFLKWCPAFKILTYFGSAKERKLKRQGWLKLNSFHICITTYRLVIQDSKVFKRKKWKYLILDEAHLIKNWKSQRWQTLLNFNSKRRILLTGTPLQNDLMELWSLMHFLMPHIFQSHQEFKDWFSNPISGMVEGQERVNKEVVDRLHNVLRPFLLRRLKRDVEKQLPMKHEHVIYCRLSKRQRNLYEDFIASSETQATLASANFFGMISIIMQLRKVCNHPDLFEGRPIVSSFDMAGIDIQLNSFICSILPRCPFAEAGLRDLGLVFTHLDYNMTSWESDEVRAIATPQELIKEKVTLLDNIELIEAVSRRQKKLAGANIFEEVRKAILEERLREAKERRASIAWWNSLRCQRKPIYSTSLRELVTVRTPVDVHGQHVNQRSYLHSSTLADIILSPVERFHRMIDLIESFMFAIPAARALEPASWCSKSGTSAFLHPTYKEKCSEMLLPLLSPIRPAIVRRQVYFPDRRLIQFDCGKLQELAVLLRRLKSEGHRALIFTQMTKMLDILEAFINLYGYTYMRLDGSTQPEERQTLMQRFNTNPKIFLFILSTRSGGVGINLVGADTVIFYDSDWNPAMDQQAQDRCHRIGQTREVHIYRLITESTIEENILRKANQKRALDDLVIQSGGYNTEFFKKLDPMELFSGHDSLQVKSKQKGERENIEDEILVSNADVEAALKYAEDEADYMALKRVEQEEAVDNQEFTEETMGRMEDDDFINDEDMKADEPAENEMISTNKDFALTLNGNESIEDRALNCSGNLDDVDMLADVREMAAAAAAAGQAISSFENQLRPIDRYAIRFLEMWDPVIDKTALDSEERFEETEWELERIEKYKEEMEAEIDDDEEPFVYERWDTDFATKAYRQQVEALAQHQLEEELQAEANEKEDGDEDTNAMTNGTRNNRKPKSKRKAKKAKFKSLKKGSLTCKMKQVKEEPSVETYSFEDEVMSEDASYLEMSSPLSSEAKKRKKTASTVDVKANKCSKKKLKKSKKPPEICASDVDRSLSDKQHGDHVDFRKSDNIVANSELKLTSRSKMGGKISITFMPVKGVLTIKPEKLKKANVWSRDCVPSPDKWVPQEDAILCAIVHEYGPNWNLVSETIYGMTAGGVYRGRSRHPVHCCERYRELIQRFVLSAPETPINEKITSMGSGKALLRVSEDNIRMLLSVAAEQPDPELLLQKHFTALLTSVWRVTSRVDQRKRTISQNGTFFGGRFFRSVNPISRSYMKHPVERMMFRNLGESKKLLAAALHESNNGRSEVTNFPSNQRDDATPNSDQLEVTLEFPEEGDSLLLMPDVINLSIPVSDLSTSLSEDTGEGHRLKCSKNLAEIRFRHSARACLEDGPGWASSPFLAEDVNTQPTVKPVSLGKHKLSSSDSNRPSKQLKRTSLEVHEKHHFDTEPVFQSMPTISSKELDLMFDSASIVSDGLYMGHLDSSITSCLDNEFLPDMYSFEAIQHEDNLGLLPGLDESEMWAEYTDVG